ncbi:ABC transporter substrate-binding protein [Marinobacter sp. OP 3.4]|uniref:ABC transporter substrate-binding protein n=1 Tax=Marinobacter sp. OP 3.4 TaxID=3076501 RepID=UPI002E1ED0CF
MYSKKNLDRQARTGMVSRRDFLKTAAAAGIVASGAGALAVPAFGAGPEDAPKRGGHFRLGLSRGSTTDTLDPAKFADVFMQSVGFAIHNYLTELTEDGELVGELAESWEPAPDATRWVFHLRKGVTFHNGKSLTAADVVASFNHHRGENSQSAAKGIVDPIASIETDGPHTVIFNLKSANADFPAITSDYHMAILPEKGGEIDPDSGIGCGGYILQNLEPGVEAVVTRNPDYWKSDRAWFDKITFLAITDTAARTNALRTGQIDAMDRVDLKTVNLLKMDPNLEVNSVDSDQIYYFPMDTQAAPFNDNNVRLALKHAVDREDLVERVLKGYGRVGNDHPIGASYRYFADLPQRQYDPDKARHYLKKAGMDSLTVDLSTSSAVFTGAVDAAVLFKEHAAQAGININVRREPADGYWDNIWRKRPWCMSYSSPRATADWFFSQYYSADAAWNDTNWKNQRFNELLVAARAELDEDKRAGMYAEMQRLIHDDGGSVAPAFSAYVSAARTNVGHGRIAMNRDMDGNRIAERWWFKD